MRDLRINKTHAYVDRGRDCYWTPKEATRSLIAIENLPLSIADPACGSGAILDVLKDAGHYVHGSDVEDYGWPHTIIRDYLAEKVVMGDVGIVTNPPYRLALQFIIKAISDDTKYIAFLLRLNFLESVKRKEFFLSSPPSRIWISSRRLPMMHRLGWSGPVAPSNCCYSWWIWESGSSDVAQIRWFDWLYICNTPLKEAVK